jgi:hypothetical protein
MDQRFFIIPCTASLIAGSLLIGCSSIDQVTTRPPVPAVQPVTDVAVTQVPLSVMIETGQSRPPTQLAALSFRISEIWVKPEDGEWHRRRTQTGSIRIKPEEPVRRTVLSAAIPTGSYESVALLIENVRAEYQGNAGGPLSSPEGTPVEIDLSFTAQRNAAVVLNLLLDAQSSVWQDAEIEFEASGSITRGDTVITAAGSGNMVMASNAITSNPFGKVVGVAIDNASSGRVAVRVNK